MRIHFSIQRKLYGALLGDMIGAPYEFIGNPKRKDIDLFDSTKWIRPTDDSCMTLAIAKALKELPLDADEETIKSSVIKSMQDIGKRYPDMGYGRGFSMWLKQTDPKPYNSFGNGAAMRISPVGWLYDSLDRTLEVAKWVTEVSHDHIEGIKGAQATAAAIFLARNHFNKEYIKNYIENNFNYNLNRTCDDIRPEYEFDVTCQGTVPEAIIAFLESTSFEDAIRNAISLGGDCDTLTCITGSIAEACYKVPEYMVQECEKRLPDDLKDILHNFAKKDAQSLA